MSREENKTVLPLPARFALGAREGLAGAVLRALNESGLPGITSAFEILGVKSASLKRLDQLLPDLAKLLEVPEHSLEATAFRADGRTWMRGFKEQRIRMTDLVFRRARICPECVAADGHTHALWSLAAYTDCHIHGRQLIDACPSCGTPITWMRPWLHKCTSRRCRNADLRQAEAPVSDPALLPVMAELARRTAGEEAQLVPECGGKPGSAHRLQDFVDLCLFVGRYALEDGAEEPKTQPSDLSEFRKVMTAAVPVAAAAWPEALYAFFERKLVAPAGKRACLTQMFPGLYRGLSASKRAAHVIILGHLEQFLLERKREVVLRIHGGANIVQRCRNEYGARSVAELAAEVGAGTELIARVAEGLNVHISEAQGGYRRLTPAEAERICDELRTNAARWYGSGLRCVRRPAGLDHWAQPAQELFFSQREQFYDGTTFPNRTIGNLLEAFPSGMRIPGTWISLRLQVTSETARSLCDRVIHRFSDQDEAIDSGDGVPPDVWVRFETALAELTLDAEESDFDESMSISAAVNEKIKRFGLSYAEVLAAILDGQLGPCCKMLEGSGLERIGIDLTQLVSWAKERRAESLGDLVDTAAASCILGERDSHVVLHLAKQMLVPSVRWSNGRTSAMLFPKDGLARFRAGYISLTEIIENPPISGIGRSARRAMRQLEMRGIYPVTGPEVDEGPKYFYVRSDIEELRYEAEYHVGPAEQAEAHYELESGLTKYQVP